MNNGTPFLSIVVPAYNVEEYLPQCVDSILRQTFTDFELLLVDDGSKDSTGRLCDEYAGKDRRIRVIHKENGGLVSARKAGLSEAFGTYVAYVDGDDWIAECMMEKLCGQASDTGADIVISDFVAAGKTEEPLSQNMDGGYYDGYWDEYYETSSSDDLMNDHTKLHVYAGPEHKHEAQKPEVLTF